MLSNCTVIWQLCLFAPQGVEDAMNCSGLARELYVEVVRGNVLCKQAFTFYMIFLLEVLLWYLVEFYSRVYRGVRHQKWIINRYQIKGWDSSPRPFAGTISTGLVVMITKDFT